MRPRSGTGRTAQAFGPSSEPRGSSRSSWSFFLLGGEKRSRGRGCVANTSSPLDWFGPSSAVLGTGGFGLLRERGRPRTRFAALGSPLRCQGFGSLRNTFQARRVRNSFQGKRAHNRPSPRGSGVPGPGPCLCSGMRYFVMVSSC